MNIPYERFVVGTSPYTLYGERFTIEDIEHECCDCMSCDGFIVMEFATKKRAQAVAKYLNKVANVEQKIVDKKRAARIAEVHKRAQERAKGNTNENT